MNLINYNILQFFKINKISALFGSLISALTPYAFGLINAGHLNKIFAMAYVPWVIFAGIYFIHKPRIISLLVLSLVTALQLWANHPQVAYYTWMVIGFYYMWILVSSIIDKAFAINAKSVNIIYFFNKQKKVNEK